MPLTVRTANDGRGFPLGGAISIGRSQDNTVVLDDSAVSRHHATLTPDGGGRAMLIDLGSANGTTVNGIRILAGAPTRVAPGDNIAIAGIVLILEASATAPAVEGGRAAAPTGGRAAVIEEAPGVVPAQARRRERIQARGAGRGPGVLLAMGVVLLFVAFVATNTVDAKLLNAGYYKGVLEHANAYERTYTEVAADPALSDEVNDLVGGIGILPGGATAAVLRIVPQTFLQGIVEAAVDRLIAYLKNHSSFDVALDATPVMSGLGLGATGFAIGELIGRPTHQAGSYQEFLFELRAALTGMKVSGSLPLVIPDYDIPANKRQEVTDIIVESAGLKADMDAARISEVAAAVAANDMEAAFRASMEGLISRSTLLAQQDLVRGKFIHEVKVDGETHYLLGPPPEVTSQLSDVLRIVHFVSWASGWGRWAAVAGMAAMLAALGGLYRTNGARALRWMGGALFAAGGLGLAGWMIGRELAKNAILDASLGPNSTVPESYAHLYRDVISQAMTDLTATVLVPCLIAVAAGVALAGASVLASRTHNRESSAERGMGRTAAPTA